MDILYAFLIIGLFGISTWLHAYNRRKVAQARLDISKIVLEMENVILKGEINFGDACHDHIFEAMLQSQRATKYAINWKPWRSRRSHEELKTFVEKVQQELSKNPKVGELVCRYFRSDFCIFRYSRPFAAIAFFVWIGVCFVGLSMLLKSLLTILTARENYNRIKLTVAEYYAKMGIRIA